MMMMDKFTFMYDIESSYSIFISSLLQIVIFPAYTTFLNSIFSLDVVKKKKRLWEIFLVHIPLCLSTSMVDFTCRVLLSYPFFQVFH